jgi:hypothetical protein
MDEKNAIRRAPRAPPNPRIICMETVRRRKMDFFSPYNNWLVIAHREKT